MQSHLGGLQAGDKTLTRGQPSTCYRLLVHNVAPSLLIDLHQEWYSGLPSSFWQSHLISPISPLLPNIRRRHDADPSTVIGQTFRLKINTSLVPVFNILCVHWHAVSGSSPCQQQMSLFQPTGPIIVRLGKGYCSVHQLSPPRICLLRCMEGHVLQRGKRPRSVYGPRGCSNCEHSRLPVCHCYCQ